MIRYIFKRILAMIPVIIGVTILIFTLLYFAKGEPAQMILGSDATKEEVDQLNEKLGLDKPYFERLTSYMEDVFLHFDMGRSYFNEASVTEDVMQRFPITLKLSLLSVTLAVLIGIPLGVIAAVKQHSWLDNSSMFVAIIGMSMPNFWLGIMLSLFFALKLRLLPSSGIGGLEYYILPCLSIALGGCLRHCPTDQIQYAGGDKAGLYRDSQGKRGFGAGSDLETCTYEFPDPGHYADRFCVCGSVRRRGGGRDGLLHTGTWHLYDHGDPEAGLPGGTGQCFVLFHYIRRHHVDRGSGLCLY